MEEIVKKIEKKKDIEMALNIYNELRNSLRHIENVILALLSIFIAFPTLLKILEVKLEVAIIVIAYLGLIAEILVLCYYIKIKNFIKRTRNIIIEDPMDVDKEDIVEFLPYLLTIIASWIVIILIILS
jgi:hypothetical protein